MTEKDKNVVEVSYANGWIHGHEVTEDDTGGARQLVGGLSTRVRLSNLYAYQSVEPGILALYVTGAPAPISLVGSLEAMDKIMGRTNLAEVEKC